MNRYEMIRPYYIYVTGCLCRCISPDLIQFGTKSTKIPFSFKKNFGSLLASSLVEDRPIPSYYLVHAENKQQFNHTYTCS